jgi:hypothetical protein
LTLLSPDEQSTDGSRIEKKKKKKNRKKSVYSSQDTKRTMTNEWYQCNRMVVRGGIGQEINNGHTALAPLMLSGSRMRQHKRMLVKKDVRREVELLRARLTKQLVIRGLSFRPVAFTGVARLA